MAREFSLPRELEYWPDIYKSLYSLVGFGPHDNKQWRVPLAIQIIPAGILGLLIFLFPESPRWLIDHNKVESGLKTLAQLHAHGNENDPWVRAEFEQIQESITYEHENAVSSWKQLIESKSNFRRVFLCVALQGSVQMTGVSAIQYFSPVIFGQIGTFYPSCVRTVSHSWSSEGNEWVSRTSQT